jgi:hypothetical protein
MMRILAFWLGYRYYMKPWSWGIFRTWDGYEFCSAQEFFDDAIHYTGSTRWSAVKETDTVFMFQYRGD